MCDVLLPSDHSQHTQGGCVMSYFPVIIHNTHTGMMCDVLLPCDHSLHTQGGCVMPYFPVIIHYTDRMDV